jgi:hypothetical protein
MFQNETLARLVISFFEMPCVKKNFIFFLGILIGYHEKNDENSKICDVCKVFQINKCPLALPLGGGGCLFWEHLAPWALP